MIYSVSELKKDKVYSKSSPTSVIAYDDDSNSLFKMSFGSKAKGKKTYPPKANDEIIKKAKHKLCEIIFEHLLFCYNNLNFSNKYFPILVGEKFIIKKDIDISKRKKCENCTDGSFLNKITGVKSFCSICDGNGFIPSIKKNCDKVFIKAGTEIICAHVEVTYCKNKHFVWFNYGDDYLSINCLNLRRERNSGYIDSIKKFAEDISQNENDFFKWF